MLWRMRTSVLLVAAGLSLVTGCRDSGTDRPAAAPGPHPSPSVPSVDPRCASSPYRPSSITIACADAGNRAEDLTWTSWGASSAQGSGTLVQNDCVPTCLNGHMRRYRASFRLEQVLRGRFSAVVVTFEDGSGPHRATTARYYL